MPTFLRVLRVACLGIASLLFTACSQAEVETTDVNVFAFLEGDWEGSHRILGTDQDFPARYEISIVDEEVLVHEFQSDWAGGFTGREELRLAPDGKRFAATWTDSAAPEPTETIGHYDTDARSLEMFGYGANWQQPDQQVLFKHHTVYGDSQFSYTMSMQQEEGLYTEVMWIQMTRVE